MGTGWGNTTASKRGAAESQPGSRATEPPHASSPRTLTLEAEPVKAACPALARPAPRSLTRAARAASALR